MATNVKVYFCDPQSPWQRGTNENTNLLLRQYFPRGTDLAPISQAQLDQVALRLNRRPERPWASRLRQVDCKQVLRRPSEPAGDCGKFTSAETRQRELGQMRLFGRKRRQPPMGMPETNSH